MPSLESAFIGCPYCGETIEVLVDCSVEHNDYIEDCSVCCCPINFTVVCEDGELQYLEARREDE